MDPEPCGAVLPLDIARCRVILSRSGGVHMDERKRGRPLPDWTGAPLPGPAVMEGRFARLERLDAAAHGGDLANAWLGHDWLWDYMFHGPFVDTEAVIRHLESIEDSRDPYFYAIRDLASGRVQGAASYLRIEPKMGVIEVGNICFSPVLQKTPVATEAMVLMMAWAFDSGYRRYEWKCDALNLPSRRAAERLGLSFEGVFRQHMVVKHRNRDTAWFAATDQDWPSLHAAFDHWLVPDNFDAEGRQRQRLSDLTHPLRVTRDPAFQAGG